MSIISKYVKIYMLYLISGRILSIFEFLLIFKLFETFPDLIFFEKIIGWFTIDHILEEYNFTSGKFFLVNEDYRSLIKNLTILVTSVCFFAQLLTPIEFILVNILFILIFIFLTNKNLKYKARLFIFIGYAYLSYTFLIINFYSLFILIKLTICIWVLINITQFYLSIFSLILTYQCSFNNFKQVVTILVLKLVIYLFFLKLEFSFGLYLLCMPCNQINNFVLEFIFKLLIVYTYVYIWF